MSSLPRIERRKGSLVRAAWAAEVLRGDLIRSQTLEKGDMFMCTCSRYYSDDIAVSMVSTLEHCQH